MSYATVNRLFTFVCFMFLPILGSLTSVLWHGGAAGSLGDALIRRKGFSRDRHMLFVAAMMYLYIATNVLSFLMHYETLDSAKSLLPLFTFFLFPFSYSAWTISDKTAVARACIFGSMVACYGAMILAVGQMYLMGGRAEGGAGNALVFSTVTCVTAAVVLAGALFLERRWSPAMLGAYGAGLVAVLLSQSRSGWLIAILTSAVVLWVFRANLRPVMTRRGLLLGTAVILLIGFAAGGLIRDRFAMFASDWEQLLHNENYDSSTGYRLALWQIGLGIIGEHPWIGHGMQATKQLIRDGMREQFALAGGFSHFHNGILTLLVESGIVGTLSILAVLAAALHAAIRTLRGSDEAIARFGAALLLVLIAAYAVNGSINLFIGHDILDTVLMMSLIVGLYLACGTSRMPQGETPAAARQAAVTG